jgi:alcohol dehydrogenase (cytochrome c)
MRGIGLAITGASMFRGFRSLPTAFALIAGCGCISGAHAQSSSPTFTVEQASAGQAIYNQSCANCHGANLDDGQFGTPLRGAAFRDKWGSKSVEELFTFTVTKMPPGAPSSLGDDQYARIIALILKQNGVTPGLTALPADPAALKAMVIPASGAGPGGGVSAGVKLPPAPPRNNPLDRITPVSDETLANPPTGEWLSWRRTYDAQGFSPLQQITKQNVKDLQVKWTWSMPAGPNEVTPLVHDGVMFVHGFSDTVQALDAKTGDFLWQYARRLPKGTVALWKRHIAIYGDMLYVPTSDTHIVALNVKTGDVVWDSPVADFTKGYGMTGGPMVAKGVVMVGTNGSAPGGNFIVGLDAKTGAERWRWSAIAVPGEPGGDTWNNLPSEKRSGGSVWVAGSYDPKSNLAYFGPAPTYDTGPMRNLAKGARSNDAWYTNSTVALNPETGKLVWHFPHSPNDQWDFDWAFERTLVTLPVKGVPKTVAITGGKQMVFDAMEADTGKYIYSFDLGLQNAIASVNPKTGAKIIDKNLIPGDGKAKMVCPHSGGGRSWLPTSYNPNSKTLFIPMVESCMDLTPVAADERGGLSSGVRWSLRPRPDSDGNYGRLQAVNLETRQTVWTQRQRAPQTSGILTTAGGVMFAGALDRGFAAYDDATGKVLWKTRLNDVPNSAPITFMIEGRQYVAVTVGGGGPQAATFSNLVPEIRNPPTPAAAVWVFELPQQ